MGELVGERKRECLSERERESERGKECVLCVLRCSRETERVHYRVRVCSFFKRANMPPSTDYIIRINSTI